MPETNKSTKTNHRFIKNYAMKYKYSTRIIKEVILIAVFCKHFLAFPFDNHWLWTLLLACFHNLLKAMPHTMIFARHAPLFANSRGNSLIQSDILESNFSQRLILRIYFSPRIINKKNDIIQIEVWATFYPTTFNPATFYPAIFYPHYNL